MNDLATIRARVREWQHLARYGLGPRPPRDVFLYALRNPLSGLYKIGVSGEFERRWTALCHQNGVALEVPALYLNARGGRWLSERGLHEKLAAHRRVGEWFAPDPPVVRAVARLARSEREHITFLLTRFAEQVPA